MLGLYIYSLINSIKFIITYYLIFIQLNLINCYFHFELPNSYGARSAINSNGDIIIEYSDFYHYYYYNYRQLYGLRQNGSKIYPYG